MFRRVSSYACAMSVALLALQSTARGQLIVGQENEFEPVYHIDIGTLIATPLFVPADNGVDFAGIEGLTVDDTGRTIYFTTGLGSPARQELYSAHYDDPDPDFPGRLRVRKVADMTFAGELPRVTGLAWDSIGNRLLTSYQFGLSAVPEGIYEVDLNTGAMTLLLDLDFDQNDIELSGLDFNPLDGFLYANNLDFSFRFLDRIDLTQPAATARTDILTLALNSNEEGLAISNGDCGPGNPGPCDNLAYLVPDDSGGTIRVADLATDTFLPDLGLTPFTNSTSSSGAGWGPNATSPTPGPNFCLVTSSTPINGSDVGAGDSITYMIRNQNCGNETAITGGTYTITLSGSAAAGATIDSVFSDSGQAMETVPDTEVSGTVANVFAGFTDNVTVNVTANMEGELIVTATFNPVDDVDAYDPNNTETFLHNVRVFPAASALASTVSGTASAAVPSTVEQFDTLGPPNRSPDGTQIAFDAGTDGSTTSDDVLMRYSNGVGTIISRENTTPVGTQIDDLFNDRISVNNAGFVAYSADTTATSDDEWIVITDGVSRVAFAQEDTVVPFPPFNDPGNGWDFGSTNHSPNIGGNNDVIFANDFLGGGIPSTQNNAVFRADSAGNITGIVAWEGVTIPTNQAGGAMEPWESFDSGTSSEPTNQTADGALCQTLLFGDLTGSDDHVLVVNNEVVIQQGQTLTGTGLAGTIGSPGSTGGVISAKMLSNGDWLAHGTTSDADEDWVVQGNGSTFSLQARQGDEIFPGAGEFWNDDSGLSYTFRAVAGNNQGDVAILGTTDNADASKNYVCVINGTTEVIREGDPVALDGDGLFNDNAFVGLPEADAMVLTDGGLLYFTTQLVDNTGSDIGDAIVTVDVSAAISPMATGADLVALKTASTDVVESLGDPITYTITVCNVGPEDATNVVINDTLPAETTFSEGSNGAMESMGVVTINLGTVEAFTSISATITVTADANGTAVNTVSVSANEADPNPGNNSASASTLIEARADVGVSKIDNGGAPVGQNYNYTVTVTNDGPSVATNVLVRDSLPAQVSFVTASLPFVQNGQDIDVTIPTIPSGGSVMYDITVTADLQFLVTNNISILSLDQVDLNPANDSFLLETINGDVADMEIRKLDDGLKNLGDDINYTIEIENLGPGIANNVVVTETLPAGVNLVSVSVPFNEVVPGVLELSFSSIAATTTETVTVVVTPTMAGSFTNMVDVTADEVDPDPANNSASVTTRVGEFRDIDVIYSEITGDPTALVPTGVVDLVGNPAVTEWDSISTFSVSPDGTTWLVDGSSDLDSTIDDVLVINSGMSAMTFAQQGQQVPGELAGTAYSFFGNNFTFNNNNDFAYGASVTAPVDEDLIFSVIGGVQSTTVRESDPALGLEDGNGPFFSAQLGNSMNSEHLLDDGTVGFYASNITDIGSDFDEALMYSSFGSSTAFVQAGIDTVAGENVEGFTFDSFRTTPDGLNWLARIDVGPDFLNNEQTLVVNDVLILRENTNFMGIDVVNISNARLLPNGDWFARGTDTLSDDWAISNGTILARTGDSVAGGAETWGDTILGVAGNTAGDYVISGNTSDPDTAFDNVIALNGTTIVVREGDPVDLDGNGMFDDNVFIGRGNTTTSAFGADDLHLTDDGMLYFIALLRDSEGNDLGSGGSIGDAFLVVDISNLIGGCSTIDGDVDGDGDADGADVQGAVDCILSAGAMGGQCDCLDYDMSGVSDLGDINDFVADLLN